MREPQSIKTLSQSCGASGQSEEKDGCSRLFPAHILRRGKSQALVKTLATLSFLSDVPLKTLLTILHSRLACGDENALNRSQLGSIYEVIVVASCTSGVSFVFLEFLLGDLARSPRETLGCSFRCLLLGRFRLSNPEPQPQLVEFHPQ